MDNIRGGKITAGKDIIKALDYIEFKLAPPADVLIATEKIDKAVELIERYFEMKLLDWELLAIALIHCYYRSNDTVVFDEILIVMGRGNGKNGFVSPVIWYLTTHYHGVRGYNIDIIANNEDQAKTSFNDVYEVLDRTWTKSKKFFYKSKEEIINLKTQSYIRYNTSNARTKDGKRSGCLVFDEIHEYENYNTIKVFTSGFGKRKHSRIFKITTNGYVRGGVLDQELKIAEDVLNGEIKDMGLLPLIYRIDKKEEAKNPDMWPKACPSLPYFPELKKEMDKEFIKMKYQPEIAIEFMTKRMNFPAEDIYAAVAEWEKIKAAASSDRPIPYDELEGLDCIGWLDYASIRDFASVGLLFKHKGKRIGIEHSFVCHKALQIESRPIKFPVQVAEEKKLITIIKGDSITADHIADWFLEQAEKYNIINIACDDYRAKLVEKKFTEVGLPLKVVRSGPITHAKVAPLIESIFSEETVIFGDNMTMRWYINNTCQEMDKKGNVTYKKIEPKTRKTDGFFGFIHALVLDSELVEISEDFNTMEVRTY
ncbi:terminase large subunit domain-containing protein [Sporomusa sp. KB1]|jgi:phage terminase large subunit-like protein|uniref:terminase large subunit domain-containing protein n=1 Tax=Sporomusa sp. KB1 TaxID=943346 RepID=UPI0011A4DA07|nr:terminase large subunit [Sporomusa sp. KB1]TWH49602.1 phage terminase large subunit-like protein [Sporomusa sp. KB1]